MSSRSSSVALFTISCNRVIAGRPASSCTKLRSPRVIVNGLPIGRQPCDTTARTGTSSEHMTATAPLVMMRSSNRMRLPPGRVAADAQPPITVSSGTCALQSRRKSSIGKENGSASVNSVPRVGSASGQPPIDTPSSVRSASSTMPR